MTTNWRDIDNENQDGNNMSFYVCKIDIEAPKSKNNISRRKSNTSNLMIKQHLCKPYIHLFVKTAIFVFIITLKP